MLVVSIGCDGERVVVGVGVVGEDVDGDPGGVVFVDGCGVVGGDRRGR